MSGPVLRSRMAWRSGVSLRMILPLIGIVAGLALWHGFTEAMGQPAAQSSSIGKKTAKPTPAADLQALYISALQADCVRAASLLEKQNFREFIEEYFPVNDLRILRERSQLQRASQDPRLLGTVRTRLASALRLCAKAVPQMSLENGVATVEIVLPEMKSDPEPAVSPKSLAVIPEELRGFGADLDKALENAFQSAKAGEWETIVTDFYPLSEVRHLRASLELGEQINIIRQLPAMQTTFIRDLDMMRGEKPVFSEGNTVAEWKLILGREEHPVRLQLQNGHWRLFDSVKGLRQQAQELINQKKENPPDGTLFRWERFGDRWRLLSLDVLELFQSESTPHK